LSALVTHAAAGGYAYDPGNRGKTRTAEQRLHTPYA
jgi:hypothetical protein